MTPADPSVETMNPQAGDLYSHAEGVDPGAPADLAYGRTIVDGREIHTGWLLEAADARTVMVDGVRQPVGAMWVAVLRDLTEYRATHCRTPVPLVVGVPSAWGSVRRKVIEEAAAQQRCPVRVTPRATLVAAAHADAALRRCAVVETTHLPVHPGEPGRSAFWDVAIVIRTEHGWVVDGHGIIEPDRTEAGICEVIDDSVDAVVVDGDDPEAIAYAVEVITPVVAAGRVIAADRALVRAYGLRGSPARPGPQPWTPGDGPRIGGRRWYRRPPVLAGLLLAVVATVGTLLAVRGDTTAGPVTASVTVDRVRLTVPGQWHRTGPPEDTDRSGPRRTVFADPGDGRRLLVVLSPVRSGASQQSVGLSLRNRIRQRGDTVVTEFSASTSYAGRDVISYREAPGSGSPIRWYVLVADGLQVSIGCQGGDQGRPLDAECTQAVGSVRVGAG